MGSFIEYAKEVLLCKNKRYAVYFANGSLVVYEGQHKKSVNKIAGVLKSTKLVKRLFRYTPRTAVFIDDYHCVISHHGSVYNLDVATGKLLLEHSFSKGMNNPLSFCTRYNSDRILIDLLYGEYFGNGERGPVSIYRRLTSGEWNEVYSFPAHTIQHIHNIRYDYYNDRYLVMTGDSDQESGIWEADYDFNSVKPIATGSQKFRACILMPTEKGIFYVTDTPLEQNYVYFLDNSGGINTVTEIAGPCIFGVEKKGFLYFATSVEGDPTLGGWKYRLSNKLGKGVRDYYSHLYRLSQDGKIEELGKIKKDWLPMWLFEFGNMKFPVTDDNRIYICPQSLKAKYGTYVIDE